MISLEYPPHDFRIRSTEGKEMIFDEIRKTWLRLTPEEWVRQNFIRYLVSVQLYPQTMIALEKKIMVGEMGKRFDIVVYDRDHRPWMMIECKAMDIPLSAGVFEQVLRYHIAVPVQYLVITNGNHCLVFKKAETQFLPVSALPGFAS